MGGNVVNTDYHNSTTQTLRHRHHEARFGFSLVHKRAVRARSDIELYATAVATSKQHGTFLLYGVTGALCQSVNRPRTVAGGGGGGGGGEWGGGVLLLFKAEKICVTDPTVALTTGAVCFYVGNDVSVSNSVPCADCINTCDLTTAHSDCMQSAGHLLRHITVN